MPSWLTQTWEVLKIVLPWLSGGLAGAILTNLISQRNLRKRTPRLLVRSEQLDFTINSKDKSLKELKVSYGGAEYEHLVLYQLAIENLSSRTAVSCPFLLSLGATATVIDHDSTLRPVNRPADWRAEAHEPGAFTWDPGELKPNDSARLRLVASAQSAVGWAFRGSDDIELVEADRPSSQSFDNEVHYIIAWLAMYLVCDSVVLFGGLLRAALVVAATPRIMRYAQFARARLLSPRPSQSSGPQIVTGLPDSVIEVVHDSPTGLSSIQITPVTRPTTAAA